LKKCLLPVLFVAILLAQDRSPDARPKFAVASIKLDNSPAAWHIGLETHPGGRIHFSGPLVFLLGFAYNLPFNSKRMTGVPDWGYKEAYVIDVAPEHGVIPAGLATLSLRERVRPMLQTLLAERFHLVIRRDSQDVPVYALTLAKGGPKLKHAGIEEKDCSVEGKIDCRSPHGGLAGISGEAVSLDDLAQFISNWTDRPVVNRTSLNVLYQIQTEGFGPMTMGSTATDKNSSDGDVRADPNRPTIAMILRKMGLRLEPAKAPLDLYVIEHVERPSAN
jgi:uncharacterized protein (TIGR03435 family)